MFSFFHFFIFFARLSMHISEGRLNPSIYRTLLEESLEGDQPPSPSNTVDCCNEERWRLKSHHHHNLSYTICEVDDNGAHIRAASMAHSNANGCVPNKGTAPAGIAPSTVPECKHRSLEIGPGHRILIFRTGVLTWYTES